MSLSVYRFACLFSPSIAVLLKQVNDYFAKKKPLAGLC